MFQNRRNTIQFGRQEAKVCTAKKLRHFGEDLRDGFINAATLNSVWYFVGRRIIQRMGQTEDALVSDKVFYSAVLALLVSGVGYQCLRRLYPSTFTLHVWIPLMCFMSTVASTSNTMVFFRSLLTTNTHIDNIKLSLIIILPIAAALGLGRLFKMDDTSLRPIIKQYTQFVAANRTSRNLSVGEEDIVGELPTDRQLTQPHVVPSPLFIAPPTPKSSDRRLSSATRGNSWLQRSARNTQAKAEQIQARLQALFDAANSHYCKKWANIERAVLNRLLITRPNRPLITRPTKKDALILFEAALTGIKMASTTSLLISLIQESVHNTISKQQIHVACSVFFCFGMLARLDTLRFNECFKRAPLYVGDFYFYSTLLMLLILTLANGLSFAAGRDSRLLEVGPKIFTGAAVAATVLAGWVTYSNIKTRLLINVFREKRKTTPKIQLVSVITLYSSGVKSSPVVTPDAACLEWESSIKPQSTTAQLCTNSNPLFRSDRQISAVKPTPLNHSSLFKISELRENNRPGAKPTPVRIEQRNGIA